MITIDNVQYRNLEEQVEKNKQDILYILEEEGVLNQFGIKVVGQITSSSQLPDPTTYQGEYGDAYAVGTADPYTLYIYTRANGTQPNNYWFNIGQFPLPGPIGPEGPTGPKGDTGTRGSIWTSGTGTPVSSSVNLAGDKYLNTADGTVFNFDGSTWNNVGNIRGPQGIQGIQGQVGPQGPEGPQGPKGETGDVGGFINIYGILDNINQLPTPESLKNLSIAYLVGTSTPYDLYIQIGSTSATAVWTNAGPFNASTLVFENGKAQNIWNADTKVNSFIGNPDIAPGERVYMYVKKTDGTELNSYRGLVWNDGTLEPTISQNTSIPEISSGYIAVRTPDSSKPYAATNVKYVDDRATSVVSEDMINSLF